MTEVQKAEKRLEVANLRLLAAKSEAQANLIEAQLGKEPPKVKTTARRLLDNPNNSFPMIEGYSRIALVAGHEMGVEVISHSCPHDEYRFLDGSGIIVNLKSGNCSGY